MRSVTRKKIWLGLALSVTVLMALALMFSRTRPTPRTSQVDPPPKPVYAVPDLRELAARMNAAAPPPGAEQFAEQRRIEQEQITQALEFLTSTDPRQRQAGAEQLGVYPGPEAQRALAQALRDDADPEVRLAAATSLGRIRAPDETAIKALLAAIGESRDDIAAMALNTLGAYLRQPGLPTDRRRQIRTGLEYWNRSRALAPQRREIIKHLLAGA